MDKDKLKELCLDLLDFFKKRYKVDLDVSIKFIEDENNAKNVLGNTGGYEPETKTIYIYIAGRHPKDTLRSCAHEIIHSIQDYKGKLQDLDTSEGYAQKNDYMRALEREAYEVGNLTFRDWEDQKKQKGEVLLMESKKTIKEKNKDDNILKNMNEYADFSQWAKEQKNKVTRKNMADTFDLKNWE